MFYQKLEEALKANDDLADKYPIYDEIYKLRAVFVTTMYWPSGDQAGEMMPHCFSSEILRASLPSNRAIHRLFEPVLSLTNAIQSPSGEMRGWLSKPRPDVMRVAWPPVIGRR